MKNCCLLCIDEETSGLIKKAMGAEYQYSAFNDDGDFFSCVRSTRPELAFLGSAAGARLAALYENCQELKDCAVVVAAEGEALEAEVLKAGADEYIQLPAEAEKLAVRAGKAELVKSAMREAREQTWMAFAYRDAALSEYLFVYEINTRTSEATLLRTSAEAEKNFYPLSCYANYMASQRFFHPDDWHIILDTFKEDSIARLLESGQEEVKVSYRVLDRRGGWDWVETKIHFVRGFYGEVNCFSYVKLIDEAVREKETYDRILKDEIFQIISVDVQKDWFRCIYHNIPGFPSPVSGCYSKSFMLPVRDMGDMGEAESIARQLSLPELVSELNNSGVSIAHVGFSIPGVGNVMTKIQAFYADERRQNIIIAVRNVTELFEEEQKHQKELEVALTAAKQASSAKSNFLSRMSHEIRTPLNAIIGMDTIAAQSITNPERVADCISKIGISARYLLSLINDILDMSRIESGKMLLKNEKFLFRDFIGGINNMIYNQTFAKGLDYECTVSSEIAEAYIGDAMKLQQILINILGNAVKFTEKGKVSVDIHPLSGKGSQSVLRFTVNDTGVGIGENFLPHIFEPFEQADGSSTATFGGTGLGLAITKNLVDLMGGSIKVRSIVGVGSEFTADIPLTIDESVLVQPKLEHNFDKMLALIVDDDLVVCEQTSNILRDIGMSGEWVTTGTEAVDRVRANYSRSQYYDYILIDWKMPDMDGIETTREIRRVVGPDVTIIIITAYDWESIEVEAKAAGANMLISKPLLKSTLVSAFQRAKNQSEYELPEEANFDFTGRRVLVVEDNQINAEIAKNLLESRHCTVELAPNGLKAMELYIQNPAGYYDAVLMDIRMPLMDGLQATINIRHWSKEDAKTIPIIAMTANAFDEDVEKSRAAGMNAHLSKPIEPNNLYAVLERLIDKQE
jgi:two-component system sensor histidine kinase/response regulator